jgi:hypothetical protein
MISDAGCDILHTAFPEAAWRETDAEGATLAGTEPV